MLRALGLAALGLFLSAPASAGPELVVDMSAGKVLIASGPVDSWHPASLTKLMTTYVSLKALREGRLSPDSPVTVSVEASRAPPSRSGLRPGSRMPLMDALRVLMVKSANDLAIAIAETVGGTSHAFIAEMNAESRRLGMTGSRWRNPHGLHHPEQVTTAKDMAILATALRRDFPEWGDLFHTHAVSLAGRVMVNHNHSVGRYPYADGMKTGFICASGFNVVTTAVKDGRQLVAVVLGEDAPLRRDAKASLLLAAGFQIPPDKSSVTLAALGGSSKPPPPRKCGRRDMGEDIGDGSLSAATMETWVRSFAAIPRDLSPPVTIRILPSERAQSDPVEVRKAVAVQPKAPAKATATASAPKTPPMPMAARETDPSPPRRF